MLPEREPPHLPVLLLFNVDAAWVAHEIDETLEETGRLAASIAKIGHPLEMVPIRDADLLGQLKGYDPGHFIVLNWCEGLPGLAYSEARVAELLESRRFIYTGSEARVLTLSEDKARTKRILRRSGVPTPAWRYCDSSDTGGWNAFPAIVKPAYEHCSAGITPESVVMTEGAMKRRIHYVLQTFHQPALVEDFIDGREFHVSLWGNGRIEMLPPAEMDFSAFGQIQDRLCTYEAKFVPDSVHYKKISTLLPAPLEKQALRSLERRAVEAYNAIGCRDYARIDIRLRDGVFFVLDVNPNADISVDASMACAAELAGYSYGAMGSRLVSLAAKRHPRLGGRPRE
jgi:D-alanine-D-alanine ligase